MKYLIIVMSMIMLSGCGTLKEMFKPDTKIVYLKEKPKTIVKYVKVKSIPIPTKKPLNVDDNLYCPEFNDWPDFNTLTNEQVNDVIAELIRLNKICHQNMEAIRAKNDKTKLGG